MTTAGRRTRWIAFGVAAALLAVGVVFWRARSEGQEARPGGAHDGRGGGATERRVPVQAARVERRDLPVLVEGLGSVIAFKTVTVRSQVDGRLDRVLFKEGQDVERGAVLAEVDPRPFDIQLKQAQAALARDTAQLDASRRNLTRYQEVGKDKLIAQQQVDDQQALVDQLSGTVRADEAQIAQARLLLDYARIRSPIAGVTGVRLVDQGNLLRAADTTGIVVVTQLDPIAVLFTLPQSDLPRVSAAMNAAKEQGRKLRVQAVPSGGPSGEPLAAGDVEVIDNQINPTTATIRLKAVFPNPRRALWPNQFVKARLEVETIRGALIVPATAIQRGPNGAYVYVVDEQKRATPRDIEVQLVQGDVAAIGKGVAVGEMVVTEGQFQLKPGAVVEVRAPGGGGRARAGDSGGGGVRP